MAVDIPTVTNGQPLDPRWCRLVGAALERHDATLAQAVYRPATSVSNWGGFPSIPVGAELVIPWITVDHDNAAAADLAAYPTTVRAVRVGVFLVIGWAVAELGATGLSLAMSVKRNGADIVANDFADTSGWEGGAVYALLKANAGDRFSVGLAHDKTSAVSLTYSRMDVALVSEV